jgi:3-hydroxyacyl-[acyl-carrier-protein] dehydratase
MADGLSGEAILPHRDPFLFLDRILSFDAKSSVGTVTFGPERDFFRGHFPDCPVVPGAVLLEAMCQSAAAGVLAGQREDQYVRTSDILLFAGADNVRFRRPVRPGETFETHAEVRRLGYGVGKFHVRGFVDGVLAAEADLICVARGASRSGKEKNDG